MGAGALSESASDSAALAVCVYCASAAGIATTVATSSTRPKTGLRDGLEALMGPDL